jgi:hypothetical protein
MPFVAPEPAGRYSAQLWKVVRDDGYFYALKSRGGAAEGFTLHPLRLMASQKGWRVIYRQGSSVVARCDSEEEFARLWEYIELHVDPRIEVMQRAGMSPSEIDDFVMNLCASKAEGRRTSVDDADDSGASGVLREVATRIYENQRALPGLGWSSGYLLPADRARFSSEDGRLGYPSLEAVEADTGPGWTWTTNWKVDTSLSLCDQEGWQYAGTFTMSSSDSWQPQQGKMSFVRRRRWVRFRQLAGPEGAGATTTAVGGYGAGAGGGGEVSSDTADDVDAVLGDTSEQVLNLGDYARRLTRHVEVITSIERKRLFGRFEIILREESWSGDPHMGLIFPSAVRVFELVTRSMDLVLTAVEDRNFLVVMAVHRDLLLDYAKLLVARIPLPGSVHTVTPTLEADRPELWRGALRPADVQAVITIANTATFCRESAIKSTERLVDRVVASIRADVKLDDVASEFSRIAGDSVRVLAYAACTAAEPHLAKLVPLPWDTWSRAMEDPSGFALDTSEAIHEHLSVEGLEESAFSDLARRVLSGVETLFLHNLGQCRRGIGETGAQQLMFDVKAIKDNLVSSLKTRAARLATSASEATAAYFERRASSFLRRLEGTLTLLSVPAPSIAQTFKRLFPEAGVPVLTTILAMKNWGAMDKARSIAAITAQVQGGQ